jgi:hypothetical protein
MGGLALKNTFTRRYQRDEYDALEQEVFAILSKTFKRFDTPRYFESKESFGDMDVIVSMEGFNGNVREYITETFKPNEIFHNGNSYSFDFKELQIDFITVAPENYDSNYHYFAFNDLGNFIGRIAQSLGFKYGQEGLWINQFYNGQKIAKVMVSKDYPKIFEFLGLDYDTWVEGFDSLEEIFEYVINSPYFDSEMFEMKNLNKINRDRNMKRKSYISFLAYIAENAPNVVYEQDKKAFLKKAKEMFPEAEIDVQIKQNEYEVSKKLLIKSKFNGGMVIEKYGITGKELGDALKGFKDYVNKFEDYDKFILKSSTKTIMEMFDSYKTMMLDEGISSLD